METTADFLGANGPLTCAPLLDSIASQAAEADRTRSVDPGVIAAIKASGLIRLSAVRDIGGGEATALQMGLELEAIAGACGSTAWTLWNHMCVFHFYCGIFGAESKGDLAEIVARREWVTFPNGAGTSVTGAREGDEFVLTGKSTFASGARYGEWAQIIFAHDAGEDTNLMVCLLKLDTPGVSIDATWDGMSVRASATDDVLMDGARVPATLVRPWRFDFHERFRDPALPMLHHCYREDWVGLSTLWLAAQGTGVASAALTEAVDEASGRRAIFGAKMAERPGVQMNLGEAAALVASARATWRAGCAESDARIAAGVTPTAGDYLRVLGYAMVSLRMSSDAMQLLVRVLGGNGLREGGSFARRFRDFQAMPIHITAHPDRVTEQAGRWLLGVEGAAIPAK